MREEKEEEEVQEGLSEEVKEEEFTLSFASYTPSQAFVHTAWAARIIRNSVINNVTLYGGRVHSEHGVTQPFSISWEMNTAWPLPPGLFWTESE